MAVYNNKLRINLQISSYAIRNSCETEQNYQPFLVYLEIKISIDTETKHHEQQMKFIFLINTKRKKIKKN